MPGHSATFYFILIYDVFYAGIQSPELDAFIFKYSSPEKYSTSPVSFAWEAEMEGGEGTWAHNPSSISISATILQIKGSTRQRVPGTQEILRKSWLSEWRRKDTHQAEGGHCCLGMRTLKSREIWFKVTWLVNKSRFQPRQFQPLEPMLSGPKRLLHL